MSRYKRYLQGSRKTLFCLGIISLLLFALWVFYFHKRVIREEFEATVLERFDPNQNISVEPGPKIDEKKGKTKENMDNQVTTGDGGPGITGLTDPKSNSPQDIGAFVRQMMMNVLQVNQAGQIPGKTGPRGMKGEPGANGGKYVRVGALYNQKYPDKHITRAAGIGPGAVLYTQPGSSKQWQQWQMDDQNKLRSVYNPNECISEKDGKLYMDACVNTSTQWQHRRTNGALMTKFPVAGKHMCMALKPVSSYPSNGPIQSGQKGPSGKNITNTDLIVLEPCSNSSEEQQWQWR